MRHMPSSMRQLGQGWCGVGMAERQGEEILWATVVLRVCGLKLTEA